MRILESSLFQAFLAASLVFSKSQPGSSAAMLAFAPSMSTGEMATLSITFSPSARSKFTLAYCPMFSTLSKGLLNLA